MAALGLRRILDALAWAAEQEYRPVAGSDARLTSRETVVWAKPRSAAISRMLLPARSPSWMAALSSTASLERGDGLGPLSCAFGGSDNPYPLLGLPRPSRMPSAAHHRCTVGAGADISAAAAAAVAPART